jgi:anti-anti-sigma regulatory factor
MKVTVLNLELCSGGERSDSAMELLSMLGTRECQLVKTQVSVDLAGEFDAYELETLCQVLDVLSHSREPACVNLSGVTFLDLGCARELAIRSYLCGGRLSLHSPSWQAAASLRACGYGHGSSLPPMTTPPMQISEVGQSSVR